PCTPVASAFFRSSGREWLVTMTSAVLGESALTCCATSIPSIPPRFRSVTNTSGTASPMVTCFRHHSRTLAPGGQVCSTSKSSSRLKSVAKEEAMSCSSSTITSRTIACPFPVSFPRHNRSELTVTIAQLNAAIKFQRALLQWSSPAQLADASLHAIIDHLDLGRLHGNLCPRGLGVLQHVRRGFSDKPRHRFPHVRRYLFGITVDAHRNARGAEHLAGGDNLVLHRNLTVAGDHLIQILTREPNQPLQVP